MTSTSEPALLANRRLLNVLTAVQTAFIQGHLAPRLFDPLLSVLLEMTGSESGLIAEVVRSPDGKPTLQPHAVTNLAWAPEPRERHACEPSRSLKCSALQSLFEAVLMSGQPVVSNHLFTEAPLGGQRPVTAFLGLPLHSSEELVGIVGLTNRPGGYDEDTIALLQPCLVTCGALLVGLRSERRRRRAEEELRRSEASVRTLVEQSPDAILIHREGNVVFANSAAVTLLGLKNEQEILGQPVTECALPGQEQALTEPSSSRSTQEVRFRHRQGRRAVGEVVTVSLVFNGAPALACFVRDISEYRQIQERLLATERLVSLGTLTAGMAHELNNPLAYMLSNLNYVLDELRIVVEQGRVLAGEQALDLLSALEETITGSHRVRDIVRDLKIFSRNPMDPPGLVDLPSLLDSCVNMVWGDLKHRARVVKDYEAVPPLQGNEARLAQVFLHLIINAIQALPPRGGASSELRIATRHEEKMVMVSIHDTGVGIPDEDLERLFDPFFTTKSPRQGTGLGLCICNDIVKELGGHITVTSQPGRGTTVRVFLPTNVHSARLANTG